MKPIAILAGTVFLIAPAHAQDPPRCTNRLLCPTYLAPLNDGSDLDKGIAICNRNATGMQQWAAGFAEACAKILDQWNGTRAAAEQKAREAVREADRAALQKLVTPELK